MFLKYNISKNRWSKRLLDVKEITSETTDNDVKMITVTTNSPHNVKIGNDIRFEFKMVKISDTSGLEEILAKRNATYVYFENDIHYNTKLYKQGYYKIPPIGSSLTEVDKNDSKYFIFNDIILDFTVNYNELTENTFSLSYNKFIIVNIDDIFNGDDYIIHIKNNLPVNLSKDDELIMMKRISYYKKVSSFTDNTKDVLYIEEKPSDKYLDYDNVIYDNDLYEWVNEKKFFTCKYIKNNLFYIVTDDDISSLNLKIGDSIETENKNIDIVFTYYKYNVYDISQYLKITIPLVDELKNGLNDEDIIKNYFDEKKSELITKPVDYEKICFSPCYYKSGGVKKILNELRFNLFFRERSGENWETDDSKGWNFYPYNINNNTFNLSTNINNIKYGDLLGKLNFNDDDIYFQKKKISKSFLRLSFYDTNNPFKQMLLFYSTIFLDSTDLYEKYVRNIDKKTENLQLVNNVTLGEDNLSVSFSTYDRYNRNKSSEGFYLYLFPDLIGKKIYMKAEFNHAGYGKTIPLICPINNSKKMYAKPFGVSQQNFPTSFLTEDGGDFNKLYENIFIPIIIDKNGFYYFEQAVDDLYDENSRKVTINLYEPRINGF